MSRMYNNYLGKAGQLFMMSEFLVRGWNVAIPEVDRGDDIFVVQDSDGTLQRVQVKTAQAVSSATTMKVQFNLPNKQLFKSVSPEVQYAFVIRTLNGQWGSVIMIGRDELASELDLYTAEDRLDGQTSLTFSITKGQVLCKGIDFSNYLNNYKRFPVILH